MNGNAEAKIAKAEADWGACDSYWIWDLKIEFRCLADLLAYLKHMKYGRGFDCDVFGGWEGEAVIRMIPSNVVRKWMGAQ